MDRLPARISPAPIVEAIFELRYTPTVAPEDILAAVSETLGRFYSSLTPLPLSQLPEAIRTQDPNLAFQATHQLQQGHHLLKLGPRTITFNSVKQYDGWPEWSAFINLVMENLEDTRVIGQVERLGLRYVNLFRHPILDRLQVDFEIHGNDVSGLCSQYRAEIPDSGVLKVLQLSNNVPVRIDQDTITGSILDIDCLQVVNLDGAPFYPAVATYADHLHLKAKELFFSLLKPEFLEALDPEYE
jgi:uncharacterized protein (TIGR04255 family)